MVEFSATKPKWKQIAGILRERIRTGEYGPDTLIVELQLAQEFEVARQTIRKAITKLRDEGLLETEVGVGSSVRAGAVERLQAVDE
ncbi:MULTISPECIES: GntR family transcriptional regulator [Streptosporangium]|uniref:DNA-binding GntR family transcriptional regulator n=1 Tax=Streptosporangium brasiliense TaxID=47480 RepID=A0ABT9RM40_9ACTN|nr:winged helix-turn-helix domain-containing protein [Streptosporangium brasiliense]MDP9870361.1 DNA-binding GntR family transcriptional regulator [Streptosporangium brasiliense]